MMVTETTTTKNHSLLPDITPKVRRQVSSRYPSPSIPNLNSSALSPLISRNSLPKRSVSVDRRHTPDLTLKPNNARELCSPATITSTRSLSVSFQGQSFSLPVSKTKTTPQSPNLTRRATPEPQPTLTRRFIIDAQIQHHAAENTKPADHHHRWPARIRQPNATILSKRLTLDCEDDQNNSNVVRDIRVNQFDSTRASFDGCKSNVDLGDSSNSVDVLNPDQHNSDGNSLKDSYSDTDSVSSGSTSGIQENGSNRLRIGPSGIIVSPKFWQETNSRMRRLQDPSSHLSTSPGLKPNTPQKNFNSKRFSSDNYLLSSPKAMASPNRTRPSSPSKFMMTPSLTSPSRGIISPRRNSVCGTSNNFSEPPSVLSFAVDVRRGKVGENRFFDAHVLRLLYNRQLQWRFINARNEDLVLKQKHSVEENLWNAWITMSDLRDSVTKKRHRLQLLRQKLKLASILKAQMFFLEDWAYIDKDHSISLHGAIEALKASTLRLPVGAGATADLQSMKDAISSALDVIQAMGSSMNSLYLQVEEVSLMVTEIAEVSGRETALLRICKEFLSVLSALKVKDCSLRTHTLQTSCVN